MEKVYGIFKDGELLELWSTELEATIKAMDYVNNYAIRNDSNSIKPIYVVWEIPVKNLQNKGESNALLS